MLNETHVTSSYTTGLTINLGAIGMKDLLGSLAINIIVQCKQMKTVKARNILESTMDIPLYDELINEYFCGVHGAVLSNMLASNVNILFKFMQDCVLNKTVEGLYLICERRTRGNKAIYELIPYALECYMDLLKKRLSNVRSRNF